MSLKVRELFGLIGFGRHSHVLAENRKTLAENKKILAETLALQDKINPLMQDGGDPLETGDRLPVREEGVGQMHEHFGASWLHRNLGMEAVNAFKHYAYFDTHDKEPSVSSERLAKPKPAIIVGSGESLDTVIDVLHKWKGGLFCSTSHITTLAKYGVTPTHIACPDPKGSMDEFAMPDAELNKMFAKSVLASTPIQPFEYTEFWKGKRQWYLIFDPTKEWYAQILKPVFDWINDLLLPFSANVPALLGIAHYLGYEPIYLIGADSCGNRYTEWRYHDGEWKDNPPTPIPDNHKVMTYQGKESNPNLMWAWRGLMCVARVNAENRFGRSWLIYNCSETGVLRDMMPFADLRKVIETGHGPVRLSWTRKRFIYELDLGLARFNTFLFSIHNGIERGTRVQVGTSYENVEEQLTALNKQLYDGVTMWRRLGAEQQANVKAAGITYDPDKVQAVDIPKYMAYFRKLKAEISRRDSQKKS